MNYVELNNGVRMPQLGLGVYQVTDPEVCERAVADALACGYRLIDTAAVYGNEEAVGTAIRKSGVPREEIFVTTKIWVADFGDEKTGTALDRALERLDVGAVDLVLLHQAMGDYYGAYRALERAYEAGKARAIGVSNFYPDRLVDLCLNMRVTPAVDQVECHPFYQKSRDLEVMRELGVRPMAWAPFAEGGYDIWSDPVLTDIARKHGKTVAQVVLHWNIQRGVVVIPKTVHAGRMAENADVWDFELDGEDMGRISALDTGKTEIFDHYDVGLVRLCNSIGREKS